MARNALRKSALSPDCSVLTVFPMRKQSNLVPEPHLDETVYLVLNDFDRLGTAYVETDTAEADLETITRNFLRGQYSRPVRVVAFNVCEQWSCDVSEDIAIEVGQPRCRGRI
jgi:hypothetical protein